VTRNLRRQQPASQVSASKTGDADAAEGGVAVSGTVMGDINLFTGTPVRTRYREQVLRIAPPNLVGRDAELAEFANFGTAQEPGLPYLWWRGKAWAGKSALMSWFVLHPPAGVRVVSFFITSRLASQDDRVAFIENVLEQLATLLDKPIPAFLTESTRDAHMLGMLSDAAHACRERGERLVLVVDGLDEDRGVTAGPRAYSIAALLPDPPPADMRIVVAGRPSPPIPTDVPEHHRLRDPEIVRRLTESPFAAVVRYDMEAELKRLLLGSQPEQDMLGLLTAARGGLSGSDLAELTDRPTWQVSDELRTVAGRSFMPRRSHWVSDSRPEVYVLGHEGLQDSAKQFLGTVRLEAYQERLHGWADRYCERGWPEDTPEYLLRGYYRLLVATGDIGRMIACATDRQRHDRLLDISGGDNAAIEEIVAAQEVVARSSEVDLSAMARLAVFRDYLGDRNTTIPIDLPAAWASLGRVRRAQELAGSIPHPGRRALSLVELVKALTATGDFQQAKSIAQSISEDGQRSAAVMVLVGAMAMAGEIGSAEALLNSVAYRGEQAVGLSILALASVRAGSFDQAVRFMTRAETGLASAAWHRRVDALTALAQVVAVLGDMDQAQALIGKAEHLVPSLKKPSWRAAAWAAIMRTAHFIDRQDKVRQIIDDAEAMARSLTDKAAQARALASLARAAGAVGEMQRAQPLLDEAEGLVRSINQSAKQAGAWGLVLKAAAAVDAERVPRLASAAEGVIRSITSRDTRAAALAALARVVIASGQTEQAWRLASDAEAITRSVVDPEKHGRDLAALAKAMLGAGMLDQAEAIGQSITSTRYRVEVLISVAKAIAAAGDLDRAKTLAGSFAIPGQRAGALAALAKNAATAGELAQAEEIIKSITSENPKAEALIGLANGIAAAGDLDRAEAMIRPIKSWRLQSSAFAELAEIATAKGKRGRATFFAQRAEAIAWSAPGAGQGAALVAVVKAVAITGNLGQAFSIARSIDIPEQQAAAQATIVKVIAEGGDDRKAINVARGIHDMHLRATAEITVAEIVAETGEADHAYRLARHAESQINRISNLSQRESLLIRLLKVIATTGRLNEAEAIIPSITTPTRQAKALITLSEMTDSSRATELIARALQLDHWTTSLAALVRVWPAALEVIVGEVAGRPHGADGLTPR